MSTLFSTQKYQPKNESVLRMIDDFKKNHEDVFIKVKTQWLPAIREFLREETGLRMHQKVVGTKIQKDTNITFHFVTDRDEEFIKLIDEHYPDLEFSEFSEFRQLQIKLNRSKEFFIEKPDEIFKSYTQLFDFLERYFIKYDLNLLINTLFKNSGKNADIWGTYYYNDSKIEVYYIPIILFCQLNNLPLEYAILSVLVHEMAHAYHNVGRDKDNVSWEKMNESDKYIVEGMAEYFTWLFVESYKANYPAMKLTYEVMFDCLGAEYKIFKSWTEIFSKETIKTALISTRKKSITKYDDFLVLIKELKKNMQ